MSGEDPRPSRKIALIVVLFSILFMLGVAEVVLRASRALESRKTLENDPDWRSAEALHRRSEDPELIYELIPSAVGERYGVEVAVNSSGFRDHEFPATGSAGQPRVVVLGDSVAWGWGVAMNRAFPQLIEEKLVSRATQSAALPVVYNLAVDGYSTRQELRLLETLGEGLAPDLVIVAYVLNDPDERVGVLRLPADGGLGAYFSESPTSEVLHGLQDAWKLLEESFGELGNSVALPEEYHHRIHALGKPRTQAYFRWLGEWSRAQGVPVLVAVLPVFDFSAHGAYPWAQIHQEVTQMAMEEGLDSVDLHEAFRGVPSVPFAHNAWHPNGRGHAVIADALMPHVRESLARNPVPGGQPVP